MRQKSVSNWLKNFAYIISLIWLFRLFFGATGQNCTKTEFHEGTKFHEDTFAWGDKIAQRQFSPRVNFALVTIMHGGSFLQDSKSTEKKTRR